MEDTGSRVWQAPTLTELGTLNSQTLAQTQLAPDADASGGMFAGSSGSIPSS
jgi:hypothetical protein